MNAIVTATERIEMDPNGIVVCTVIENVYMDHEDAVENIEAVKTLAKGKKVPVLVDIRKAKGASKECRSYYASEAASKVQSASALLIDSPLSRLIGNFFLGLNKPLFPTRLFTSEEEAREWLKGYL